MSGAVFSNAADKARVDDDQARPPRPELEPTMPSADDQPVMDWATRHVPAWRLSNTMDAGSCVEALNEALSRYGKPEIFNAGQGSQFTSFGFAGVLE